MDIPSPEEFLIALFESYGIVSDGYVDLLNGEVAEGSVCFQRATLSSFIIQYHQTEPEDLNVYIYFFSSNTIESNIC